MNTATSTGCKILCLSMFYASTVVAQQLDPRLVTYPDLIVVNVNVVSMEDDGVNEDVGSTYQALAVRDSRILGLGTTEEIRRMAGPTQPYTTSGVEPLSWELSILILILTKAPWGIGGRAGQGLIKS